MPSRQAEKARLRRERLAREQTEASAAARRKRVQLALAALLGLGVVAAIAVLVGSQLGGSGADSGGASRPVGSVTLPPQQTSDLATAAKTAGCELQNPKLLPAAHEAKAFTPADYNTNPPSSGPHNPVWYDDGVYAAGQTPQLGKLVHTLEHGRIDVQYRPGTSRRTVSQLESLLSEQSDGYHMLLFQNTTGMKYAVAATAWGHVLGCSKIDNGIFDALRTFRERYVDKGPETVP